MEETENTKLIRALKAGDKKIFKQICFQYYSKLLGISRQFNFKLLAPEDFVQETFLRLYNKRQLLKDNVLFDKQLFSICRNIIIDHLRRENKVIPLNALPQELRDDDDGGQEEEEQEKEKQKERLSYLLQELPKKQREVFTLHKINNYTYHEIAEITNLSKKTIANHIYLANKYISKKVQNN